jgi:hypothetical protein
VGPDDRVAAPLLRLNFLNIKAPIQESAHSVTSRRIVQPDQGDQYSNHPEKIMAESLIIGKPFGSERARIALRRCYGVALVGEKISIKGNAR